MSDTLITEAAPSAPNPTAAATEGTPALAPNGQENPVTPGAAMPAQKAAEDQAAAAPDKATTKQETKADEKAAGAPEKYTDFTAPEGSKLDSKVMEQFATAARELNLPQDAAQKMVDKMAPLMAQRQAEQVEQFKTEWHAQSTADTEFGGDKLQDSMVHAKRALEAYATPELKQILNESGLGNHPEVVRFMVRAGKNLGQDKVIIGSQAATNAKRSAAEVLYGEQK